LILAALAEIGGDFEDALHTVARLLGAEGIVVPATTTRVRLEATVGGREVIGQVAVAVARGVLEDLRLVPGDPPATRRAVEALESAEQIVLGPGSLFTSIAACLLVPGITAALNDSSARIVYICNLTTQDGETLGMDAADHVTALMRVSGIRTPDVVVAHQGPVRAEGDTTPVALHMEGLVALGCRVEAADLADPRATHAQHDPARLGAVLRRLA
jgi:uncharacterized cofD-like protein